jgi:hypothetical protein
MNARTIDAPRIGLPLVCTALLAACGNSPPSTDQANAALKELPQMQLLLGNQINNASLHLVSDMKCDPSGDHKFKCQVLLPKNPFNGSQETLPVEFVKLDGKWRAIPDG